MIKIVFLAKTDLNNIEALISLFLTDSYISHDEPVFSKQYVQRAWCDEKRNKAKRFLKMIGKIPLLCDLLI